MLLALKVLAMAGGFGVGAFASGFVVRFLTRLLTARAVHWLPLRLVQLLCGTTLGLAIWFFGLGWGGNGFGLGEGRQGRGQGSEVRDEQRDEGGRMRDENRTEPTSSSSLIPHPSSLLTPIRPLPSDLRIELLGGPKVHDERFYVLDGEPKALSLPELQQCVFQCC